MQEKHERMKKLKTLRETESKFCNQMCLPVHNLGDVNVPTKEQLKELEANVEYLQKEHVSGVMSLIDLGNVVLVQEGKDLRNGCVILKRISPFQSTN